MRSITYFCDGCRAQWGTEIAAVTVARPGANPNRYDMLEDVLCTPGRLERAHAQTSAPEKT